MNEQFRGRLSLERVRAVIEDIRTARVKPGPHLTDEQLDAFSADRLDEQATASAIEHIDSCEECAVEVIARAEARRERPAAALTAASAAVVPLRVAVAQTPLTFEPHHDRVPPPGCVAPLEWAATKEVWPNIQFLPPRHRRFALSLPSPRIRGGICPLIVTTAFRAAMEHRCNGAWRTVIPLALAPRETRIVTTATSTLAKLADYDLMNALRGRLIAVGDATSTYAARLVAAARHYNIKIKGVTERPRRIDPNTLYLIAEAFSEMATALEHGEIDGFATVEPFPTLTKDRFDKEYGPDFYAEATLGPDSISTSTSFCCVVMAPRALVEQRQYEDAYRTLVQTLFRSLWRVIKNARFEVGAQEVVGSVDANRAGSAGDRAAAAMLRHFLGDLDLDRLSGVALIQTLVERFVPEMTRAALNADCEALSGCLSRDDLRLLTKAGSPVALYSSEKLRDICRSALDEELGDAPSDAVRNAKRVYDDRQVAQ